MKRFHKRVSAVLMQHLDLWAMLCWVRSAASSRGRGQTLVPMACMTCDRVRLVIVKRSRDQEIKKRYRSLGRNPSGFTHQLLPGFLSPTK